jgi:hypothetical protein
LQRLNYNLDVQLATEREARKKLAEKLERRRRRLGKSAIPPRVSTVPVSPEPSSVVEEKDVTISKHDSSLFGTVYRIQARYFGFYSNRTIHFDSIPD